MEDRPYIFVPREDVEQQKIVRGFLDCVGGDVEEFQERYRARFGVEAALETDPFRIVPYAQSGNFVLFKI